MDIDDNRSDQTVDAERSAINPAGVGSLYASSCYRNIFTSIR